MSESMWIERAQSAEAKITTLKDAMDKVVDRVKTFKMNFGIKERDNGEIVIDYDKFVERLGYENAMELKKVIEETYKGH